MIARALDHAALCGQLFLRRLDEKTQDEWTFGYRVPVRKGRTSRQVLRTEMDTT